MKQIFRRFTAIMLLLGILLSFVVPATFADTAAGDTVVETYDLIVADHENATIKKIGNKKNVLTSACGCKCGKTAMAHIAELYDAGTLNWQVIATTDTQLTYRNDVNNYLRLTAKDSWTAFKVRVPESGNFVLTNQIDPAKNTTKKATVYAFPPISWMQDWN